MNKPIQERTRPCWRIIVASADDVGEHLRLQGHRVLSFEELSGQRGRLADAAVVEMGPATEACSARAFRSKLLEPISDSPPSNGAVARLLEPASEGLGRARPRSAGRSRRPRGRADPAPSPARGGNGRPRGADGLAHDEATRPASEDGDDDGDAASRAARIVGEIAAGVLHLGAARPAGPARVLRRSDEAASWAHPAAYESVSDLRCFIVSESRSTWSSSKCRCRCESDP